MRHDDDGLVLEQVVERDIHLLLVKAVERGSGLVQKHDIRVLEHDFRDGEPLFLSAGKPDSTFSDFGLDSFFEFQHEFAFRGPDHPVQFVFGRSGFEGIGQVFINRSVEYARILRQVPDVPVIVREFHLAQFLAVDKYFPLVRGNISGKQFHERGLPAAGFPDERRFGAPGNHVGKAREYARILMVPEGNVSDFDGSVCIREILSGIGIFYFRTLVDEFPKLGNIGKVLEDFFVNGRNILHALFKIPDYGNRENQVRIVRRSLENPRSDEQDQHSPDDVRGHASDVVDDMFEQVFLFFQDQSLMQFVVEVPYFPLDLVGLQYFEFAHDIAYELPGIFRFHFGFELSVADSFFLHGVDSRADRHEQNHENEEKIRADRHDDVDRHREGNQRHGHVDHDFLDQSCPSVDAFLHDGKRSSSPHFFIKIVLDMEKVREQGGIEIFLYPEIDVSPAEHHIGKRVK